MRYLLNWLHGLKFQILILLPVGFKLSWGNWGITRGEEGIYTSKYTLNQGEFEDGTPFSIEEMKRRIGQDNTGEE